MQRPNHELGYSFADLYPSWGGTDTSNLATPETDDLEALGEDTKTAEESSTVQARSKNVFVALIILGALVVFLGGK